MALGKMTKSENCFQILEVSLSIPLNKDDHDPLQEMYITHDRVLMTQMSIMKGKGKQ